MIAELFQILDFIVTAFFHIWPYLLVTIPIAVAVKMSGASSYIQRLFDAGPVTAILLATGIGAFSPFCSCTVIPVIASLLIGGVPLPPVMAFWIASPSMDPEIFFLSVGTIGWNLAVWRLIGTLVMSLGAGLITLALFRAGWIRPDILKQKTSPERRLGFSGIKQRISADFSGLGELLAAKSKSMAPVPASACCRDGPAGSVQVQPFVSSDQTRFQEPPDSRIAATACEFPQETPFWHRLAKESMDASIMVIKFMALAFFLEALIIFYVPEELITGMMGKENSWAILTAAFVGIPVYTSNLSALPMVNGLLAQGMSPSAALAFLIAGPTTTLPAMAAVWTLVKPRIFILYVSYALAGAILLGYLNSFWG